MIYIIILLLLFGFYSLGISRILKIVNKYKKRKNVKEIYLTFDDGPSEYTDELLDLLQKYNIKASFFVVSEFVLKYGKIIERMKKDGHCICLHSFDHVSEALKLPLRTVKDINKSLNIMNQHNIKIKYFRAPWGQFNIVSLYYMKKHNIKRVMWDIMAEDWEKNTTSLIIRNKLIKRVNGGEIICLHDGRGKDMAPKRTIGALKEVLPIWIEKGFIFKTMDKYYE